MIAQTVMNQAAEWWQPLLLGGGLVLLGTIFKPVVDTLLDRKKSRREDYAALREVMINFVSEYNKYVLQLDAFKRGVRDDHPDPSDLNLHFATLQIHCSGKLVAAAEQGVRCLNEMTFRERNEPEYEALWNAGTRHQAEVLNLARKQLKLDPYQTQ